MCEILVLFSEQRTNFAEGVFGILIYLYAAYNSTYTYQTTARKQTEQKLYLY